LKTKWPKIEVYT